MIQGAVVLRAAVICTLLDSAFNALVCMTIHKNASFFLGSGIVCGKSQKSYGKEWSFLAFFFHICYFKHSKKMHYTFIYKEVS